MQKKKFLFFSNHLTVSDHLIQQFLAALLITNRVVVEKTLQPFFMINFAANNSVIVLKPVNYITIRKMCTINYYLNLKLDYDMHTLHNWDTSNDELNCTNVSCRSLVSCSFCSYASSCCYYCYCCYCWNY